MTSPLTLPRRDSVAREVLDRADTFVAPLVPTSERTVALAGVLGGLVPGGGLVRGATLRVDGAPGSGATTVAFELVAAVTRVGEWAAVVDLTGTVGMLAAQESGVALERCAVVQRVPPARWPSVVAALLDGVSIVLAEVPRGVKVGDARRLAARARERGTVLVVSGSSWPGGVALTLCAEASVWVGLSEQGMLTGRDVRVRVDGRGAATRARVGDLARAG
jgi:hypothetical protein